MQQVLNAQIEPSPELAQGMRRTTLTNSAQDQADPMQRKLPNWALPFGRRSFPSHQGHGLLESFLSSRAPSVLSGAKSAFVIHDEITPALTEATKMEPTTLLPEEPSSKEEPSISKIKTKYEFVESDSKLTLAGRRVWRIRALVPIPGTAVKAGDLGGFIFQKSNLEDSLTSGAWVYDNAIVDGNARVEGNATVHEKAYINYRAVIKDDAMISGSVNVGGNACFSDDATAQENAVIGGDARVRGYSSIRGRAHIDGGAVIGLAGSGSRTIIQDNALVNGYARIFGSVIIGGDVQISGCAYIYDSGQIFFCKYSSQITVTPTLEETKTGIQVTIARGNSYVPESLLALLVNHNSMPRHQMKVLLTVAQEYIDASRNERNEDIARDASYWV
jgi:UDP-3-O-[3-hydroxymyristoyl] glucosamine N-acyltransferase